MLAEVASKASFPNKTLIVSGSFDESLSAGRNDRVFSAVSKGDSVSFLGLQNANLLHKPLDGWSFAGRPRVELMVEKVSVRSLSTVVGFGRLQEQHDHFSNSGSVVSSKLSSQTISVRSFSALLCP